VLETDLAAPERERFRVGRVLDFLFLLEQREHALDVGQRLLDLAVDHAEVIERDGKLDQERVDEHEVAEAQPAGDDAGRRTPEQKGQARRDDAGLADVQHGERLQALDGGFLELHETAVVAGELVPLVAEILDRLVVQQRIDRARVSLGVGRVRRAVVTKAPLGDRERERDIDDERRERDRGETPVVAHDQDAADEGDFEQRRQDRVDRPVEEVRRRRHPALDVARDAAGAPVEMKAQRECVQVLEHAQCDLARGARHHAREDDLAQFLEQRGRETQRAICDEQQQRNQQRLRRDVERGDEAGGAGIGGGHDRVFTWGSPIRKQSAGAAAL
jgi:hypothetical protein